MKRFLILFVFTMSISGCLNTVVHLDDGQMVKKPEKKIMYPSVAAGMVELKKFRGTRNYCTDKGIHTVRIYRGAVDSIIHFIGGIFYTSRTIEINCNS